MAKWHVNQETGNVGKCSASIKSCPFGEESEHYSSRAEALYAYESANSKNTFNQTLKKKNNKSLTKKAYRFVALGGVALSSMSLVACESDIAVSDDGNIEITVDGETVDIETSSEPSEPTESASDSSNEESSSTSNEEIVWQGRSIQPSSEEVEEAKNNLNELVIADELVRPDYSRDEMFGSFKSGTVESIQLRDLPNAEFGENAKADGGYMIDPYTGDHVEISAENRADIDTEHIIALKEVTESERIVINSDSEAQAIKEDPQLLYDYVDSGEANFTEEEIQSIMNNPEDLDLYYLDSDAKKDIANDEDNLAIVGSSANRSKGDQDPGQWMPSYEPIHCTYIVSSIKVKTNYNLSVDSQEESVMRDTLENKCG